jgi:hypothetical protein
MPRKIIKKKKTTAPVSYPRSVRSRPSLQARLPIAPRLIVLNKKAESRLSSQPRYKAIYQAPRSVSKLRDVYVYVAGCAGLKALSEFLGEPGVIFKLGLSASGYLDRRIMELGRDQYAACWRKGDDLIADPGFTRWELQQIITGEMKGSSVTRGIRHLKFKLPEGYSLEAFDVELRRAFSDLSLQAVLRGQRQGSDQAKLARFTRYQFGLETQVKMATELFCLKPRMAGNAIVARIDALLLRLARPRTETMGIEA